MSNHAARVAEDPLTKEASAQPEVNWHLGQFALISVQLGLLLLVIRQFQIENAVFLRVALLAFAGFAVHHFLPFRFRLPFFAVLSLAAIGMVFGFADGSCLVLIGLGLIGICHIPISFSARVALLLLAGGALAAMRSQPFGTPWSQAIWPILGSMFMFRLIVYLYDLRHDKAPFSIWRTISYFFLLPNVCFPLFPVVDFKAFRRTYYNDEPCRIYQKGVDWMVAGVSHLVLYRVVYFYGAISPSEVLNPADLFRFLTSNFLLYLRVSGQFHMIVGMLHLFGFNLLRTNDHYCLSSSFSDFWRRINIYWKDFMMKVVYYPLYMRLRGIGGTTALILSTVFVFVVTWFLHSYQWFWIRGSFPLIWQDAVFWAILCVLLIGNSLYEARYGRRRSLGKQSWNFRAFAVRTVSTIATFGILVSLWALWTCDSFASWVSLWSALGGEITAGALVVPALVLAIVVTGGLLPGRSSGGKSAKAFGVLTPRFGTLASLLLLAILGLPQFYTKLGPDLATYIHSLKSGGLSRLDRAKLQRGYYEDLTRVAAFNSQLWEVYMTKPLHWLDVRGSGLKKYRDDFLQFTLLPSTASNLDFGTLRTNRWGMRDQEYDETPAPGTHRTVLLGASTVMGWGVQDDETFEAIIERRLNREHAGNPYRKYEILNCSVAGYSPLHQLPALEAALRFEPHAVFFAAGTLQLTRAAEYLAEAVRQEIHIPYEFLRDIAASVKLDPNTAPPVAAKRLTPYREEILSWLYSQMVQRCRERNVLAVWTLIPQVTEGRWRGEASRTQEIAEQAGFSIIDLSDVYKGHEVDSIRVAQWDDHPNARGHRLIADRLYEILETRGDLFFAPRDNLDPPEDG